MLNLVFPGLKIDVKSYKVTIKLICIMLIVKGVCVKTPSHTFQHFTKSHFFQKLYYIEKNG